ncbi:MAG: iron-containing redox enzyme family protein [Chloroflexota bacterium]
MSFARGLIEESRRTHPWLNHQLFKDIWAGKLAREQVREVVKQQGAFFLDTIRHAAVRLANVGGRFPTRQEIELQRAMIPTLVEEAGLDTLGGKPTAHPLLFARLAEGFGIGEDELFGTEYLPEVVIEKDTLFLLQAAGPLEALCGGALASEAINHEHSGRMLEAYRAHYGIDEQHLTFYAVHAGGIEEEHGERGIELVDGLATTPAAQAAGRLAMRRAIAARTAAADAMYRLALSTEA